MNTITFGHVRLQGGVRFEGTQGSFIGNKVVLNTDGSWNSTVPVPGAQSYVTSCRASSSNTLWREHKPSLAYGRGIAGPISRIFLRLRSSIPAALLPEYKRAIRI